MKTLFTVFGKCVLIGVGLQMWQQLLGINTVMYYGPILIEKAGFGGDGKDKILAIIYTMPLAAMNFAGTVVVIFIIDKFGRRWIILRSMPFIGSTLLGIAIGSAIHSFGGDRDTDLAGAWVTLVSIFLYIGCFAVGMGTTPWAVNSEIYPLHLRGAGNSLSTTSNWVFNYLVSQLFLTLTKTPAGMVATFAVISLFAVGCFLFVYFLVPETKGKSIEENVKTICPHAFKNTIEYEEKTEEEEDQALIE